MALAAVDLADLRQRTAPVVLAHERGLPVLDPLEPLLPDGLRRLVNSVVAGLMALMALFMTGWGAKLVEATWHNTIADFPALSVGVTYLPIPIGGAILLLFVIELAFIGPPPEEEEATPAHPPIVAFE